MFSRWCTNRRREKINMNETIEWQRHFGNCDYWWVGMNNEIASIKCWNFFFKCAKAPVKYIVIDFTNRKKVWAFSSSAIYSVVKLYGHVKFLHFSVFYVQPWSIYWRILPLCLFFWNKLSKQVYSYSGVLFWSIWYSCQRLLSSFSIFV